MELTPNYNSFAPITREDHAGYLWVAAMYCIITSGLVFFTRVWIKQNNFGHDDSVFAAATAAQIGQVAAVFVALNHGLGSMPTQASSGEFATGGEATFVAQIFLIIALALAKISVVLFMQRLLARDMQSLWMVCWGFIVVIALWAVGSIAALSANCSAHDFIGDDAATTCGNQALKWRAIAAFDVVTEFMLVIMPIVIVWPLQMAVNLKVQVIAAFTFRLGVAALAIAHAVFVARYASASHPSLAMVPTIVFAEAELCWSLVSATIPNLKNFMKSFSTGFGHEFGLTSFNESAYQSGSHNRDRGIRLKPLSKTDSNARSGSSTGFVNKLNPGAGDYEIDISRGNGPESSSIASGKSQELIIRKDFTMTVDHKKRSKGVF